MRTLLANGLGFTPEMCDRFRELGLEPEFLPLEDGTPGTGAKCGKEQKVYDLDYSDLEAVVCYQFFNYNDISRFPNLKYIHTTSSGLDHMPMDYIREHGIHLCNACGVYSNTMAEFALSGVLQFYKGAPLLRERQKAHQWKRFYGMRELADKTVTILGSGSIGTECAKRFSAMGCRCIGMCRHPNPAAEHYADQRHIDELDALLPETDILLISLPLTDETRALINERRLALMKNDAILVNIARGPIVDTAALVSALNAGTLGGAVVDVVDEEPLAADSPLWDAQNLLLTPHNSYVGEFNMKRMFDLVYKDTVNWLKMKEEAK